MTAKIEVFKTGGYFRNECFPAKKQGIGFTLGLIIHLLSFSVIAEPLREPEYPPTTTQQFAIGLYHKYYEGAWSALPDFNSLSPVRTFWSGGFTVIRFDTGVNFGYQFSGFIDVPSDGIYTFFTTSNDGSRLLIGNTVVVDNDGLHSMQERSGSIGLKAGKHAFTVLYFHGSGPFEGLELHWQGPNLGKQIILSGGGGNAFFHIDDGATHRFFTTYILLDAQVQKSPPQITLNWTADPNCGALGYQVYRKSADATFWGIPIATLSSATTSYTDLSVAVGTGYEYKVEASCSDIDTLRAVGVIYSGIELPLTEDRGKVILLVDNSFTANLAIELAGLEQDLVGDGWTVLRHDVSRTDTVSNIKALIQSDYNADPANVKALFLFGHIPIPYSGFYRTGHNNSTLGAWPSDAFYGNFTGPWTDFRVDTRTEFSIGNVPLNSAIANTPNDGKYDQTFLPSDMALEIGRVDFWNITTFAPKTEEDLLRQYLNKDHNFRNVLVPLPQRRGYMQNNSANPLDDGYGNYSAYFGRSGIDHYDGAKFTWGTLDHLCAASLPPPSFAQQDYKAVFILTYISGVPEWDVADSRNVYSMREALGMPTYSLTSGATLFWNWYLHHMALGETIGYGVRLSQSNTGLYPLTPQSGDTSMEMMGDPTLRLHPVVPPSGLTGLAGNGKVDLTWVSSPDTGLQGYHVYRAASAKGPFSRINSSLLQTTSYTDSGLVSGTYSYLVRAVKLEQSSSGSFANPSQGIILSVTVGGGANNTPPSVRLTSPAENAVFAALASITLAATASDTDGTVSKVEFFNGTNLLATGTTSSYSFTWNDVVAGSYTLTARATDDTGAVTTSSPINITVNASGAQAEFVRGVTLGSLRNDFNGWLGMKITVGSSPLNVTTLGRYAISGNSGLHIVKLVSAGDGADVPGGSVSISMSGATAGQFKYLGLANPVTLASNSSYYVVSQESPEGDQWAVETTTVATSGVASCDGAILNSGSWTFRPPANTTFVPVNFLYTLSNQAPAVNITSPAQGATFTAPADIALNAEVSDTDGTVSKVEFFDGTTLLGSVNASPYTFNWTGVPPGNHVLTAKATDNANAASMSPVVVLKVVPPLNTPPTIAIISPTNTAGFIAPANITIVTDPVDSDGNVSAVEFYVGSTLLGTAANSPFSFDWQNVPPGTYLLTAKAIDDVNQSTTSFPVSITVNSVASLSISHLGSIIVIAWTGGGTLESAPAIDGPWLPVFSPANPYFESLVETHKFFRLR